ncbi:hypothetical protein NDU88_001581 [Pleurodeles waltl]|uniref:Uncharacterized protein n=1 Tax=Pleurodeles waltl TaxID=8319 RepID=A0AAV7KSC5_PLEWA|nr:hypothetical protein NDU88_001581 [Pleurodeles waltl]
MSSWFVPFRVLLRIFQSCRGDRVTDLQQGTRHASFSPARPVHGEVLIVSSSLLLLLMGPSLVRGLGRQERELHSERQPCLHCSEPVHSSSAKAGKTAGVTPRGQVKHLTRHEEVWRERSRARAVSLALVASFVVYWRACGAARLIETHTQGYDATH